MDPNLRTPLCLYQALKFGRLEAELLIKVSANLKSTHRINLAFWPNSSASFGIRIASQLVKLVEHGPRRQYTIASSKRLPVLLQV